MRTYTVTVEPETLAGLSGFKVVLRDSYGNAISIPLNGLSQKDAERAAPGIAHAFNAGAHAYRCEVADALMRLRGIEAYSEIPTSEAKNSP